MKKVLNIFLTVIISLILTFGVAQITGWYHIGEAFTKSSIVRLIGFFFIMEGLILCIYTFIITSKEKAPTK